MLTLRDRNLRMTLLNTIADAVADAMKAERVSHLEGLVDLYEASGVKSMDVRLPNGVKVATISLTIPKDSIGVTDEAELIEWAKDNAPWLLKERHVAEVPAQPAYTETVVDPKRLTEFLASVKPLSPDSATVVDPSTGALVDGVAHQFGGAPKSFSVRYAPDGKENLTSSVAELADLVDDVIALGPVGGGSGE